MTPAAARKKSPPVASLRNVTPTLPGTATPAGPLPTRLPGKTCARCLFWPSCETGRESMRRATGLAMPQAPIWPGCTWPGGCGTIRPVIAAAREGRLRLGLSAAWLLTALGRPNGHRMDASLVQAMGLYDFRAAEYWEEWVDRLGVPRTALPEVAPTIAEFGEIRLDGEGSAAVPVLAMIGDQQGRFSVMAAEYPARPNARKGRQRSSRYLWVTTRRVRKLSTSCMPGTPATGRLSVWKRRQP